MSARNRRISKYSEVITNSDYVPNYNWPEHKIKIDWLSHVIFLVILAMPVVITLLSY